SGVEDAHAGAYQMVRLPVYERDDCPAERVRAQVNSEYIVLCCLISHTSPLTIKGCRVLSHSCISASVPPYLRKRVPPRKAPLAIAPLSPAQCGAFTFW